MILIAPKKKTKKRRHKSAKAVTAEALVSTKPGPVALSTVEVPIAAAIDAHLNSKYLFVTGVLLNRFSRAIPPFTVGKRRLLAC